MIFCGNCGLRLAPGDKQCTRCGTLVESDILAEEDAPPDAPTTASPSLLGRMQPQATTTRQAGPNTPANQQKIILRPGQNASNDNYGTQMAGEATRCANAQDYGTAMSRPPTNPGTSYPGYPQSGGNYPPQGASYSGYPQSGGSYPPQGASYPGFVPQENIGPYTGHYPPQAAPTHAKGRSTALIIILPGLLLILISMTLFILQRNGIIGTTSSRNPTPTAIATLTPEQQAQALIQQHYDYINSKNYAAAYNLWKDDPQRTSLAGYEDGYKNTVSDTVTYDNVAAQGDGTVKVSVTIKATEKTVAGDTTTSTYQGYYIVGPQNNSLKILQGVLNKV